MATKMTLNGFPYGYKHIASKKMRWKEILQFTKNGPAKYKPEINVELLETMAWQKGTMIPVRTGKFINVKK